MWRASPTPTLVGNEVWWQLDTREVGLKKKEHLEMRRLEICLVQFDRYTSIDITKEYILGLMNGN